MSLQFDVLVTEFDGHESFSTASVRAIEDISGLTPLPADFPEESLRILLTQLSGVDEAITTKMAVFAPLGHTLPNTDHFFRNDPMQPSPPFLRLPLP